MLANIKKLFKGSKNECATIEEATKAMLEAWENGKPKFSIVVYDISNGPFNDAIYRFQEAGIPFDWVLNQKENAITFSFIR